MSLISQLMTPCHGHQFAFCGNQDGVQDGCHNFRRKNKKNVITWGLLRGFDYTFVCEQRIHIPVYRTRTQNEISSFLMKLC